MCFLETSQLIASLAIEEVKATSLNTLSKVRMGNFTLDKAPTTRNNYKIKKKLNCLRSSREMIAIKER